MALGYAQSTGRLGVCSVVPGPGILNASAGLLTAMGTSTPVLALTGEIPSDYLGRGFGHVHEMPDQLATLRGVTKHAELLLDPENAATVLAVSIRTALQGRPGPTAIATPWDVLPRRYASTMWLRSRSPVLQSIRATSTPQPHSSPRHARR